MEPEKMSKASLPVAPGWRLHFPLGLSFLDRSKLPQKEATLKVTILQSEFAAMFQLNSSNVSNKPLTLYLIDLFLGRKPLRGCELLFRFGFLGRGLVIILVSALNFFLQDFGCMFLMAESNIILMPCRWVQSLCAADAPSIQVLVRLRLPKGLFAVGNPFDVLPSRLLLFNAFTPRSHLKVLLLKGWRTMPSLASWLPW
jgi:hypothetical protein